jgi:hypothetical protein
MTINAPLIGGPASRAIGGPTGRGGRGAPRAPRERLAAPRCRGACWAVALAAARGVGCGLGNGARRPQSGARVCRARPAAAAACGQARQPPRPPPPPNPRTAFTTTLTRLTPAAGSASTATAPACSPRGAAAGPRGSRTGTCSCARTPLRAWPSTRPASTSERAAAAHAGPGGAVASRLAACEPMTPLRPRGRAPARPAARAEPPRTTLPPARPLTPPRRPFFPPPPPSKTVTSAAH